MESNVDEKLLAASQSAFPMDVPGIVLGAIVHDGAINPAPTARIPLSMLTRHGLVAGATGTGKTKSLQLMAEQLSAHGVPVFAADIKGDLSGISVAGEGGEKIVARAASVGQEWTAT